MKSRTTPLVVALLLLTSTPGSAVLAAKTVRAQTNQKPDETTGQKVVIGTSEVLLDVVVRDKKGRPVKDLGASDFQIFEDGVKQDIQSFRLHQEESGESAVAGKKDQATTTPTRVNPLANSNVIAVVFDRLTPEARELAHKAALSYVTGSFSKDDLAGVFLIDQSLKVFQQFTGNADLLSKAIDQAATYSSSMFPSDAEQIGKLSSQMQELQIKADAEGAAASARQSGPNGIPNGGDPSAFIALKTAQMTLSALLGFEELERDEQGYATTTALLAIIDAMRGIHGRKAIVFLSEGVALRPEVVERFQSVINEANRANVSIYGVDAAGLRITSPLEATRNQTNAIAAVRMASQESGAEDTSGRPMTKDLERNEDVLRLNPHSGLSQLSDQTGGFLIKDTNDLKSGLAKIDEDLRFHYELSYIPKNSAYDGKFREISVKLDKSNLDVQTRKGYYAVPGTGSPVLAYEVPALSALANSRAKNDPKLRAAAFSFAGSGGGLWDVPVLLAVPAGQFAYEIDKVKNTYKADFTIVALFKDQSGQPAGKLSQHYLMTGPVDKLDAAKQGEVLFYRQADLPAGKYSVESLTYDALTGRANVKNGSVEVPAGGDDALRMSSIALIRRVEKLSEADQKVDNPFHYGQMLVYPNLGLPLNKTTSKQVAFFCDIYPAKASSAAPKLDLKILSAGQSIFDTSPPLGPADARGRIQYAGALPLDAFQPGTYVLQLTASDGRSSATRSAEFTVK